MNFPPMNFDGMNEADVRAEVIDPLLRLLGYRSGTEFNIVRERTLRYPRVSLGRKKSTDRELRGKADYVLEIRGVDRWTLEAKPPNDDISSDDIHQAYSYAINPDVAAGFFVLCNGRRLLVFRTIGGPNVHPVIDLCYEELPQRAQVVINTLSPASFKKAVLSNHVDTGRPLASGLDSMAHLAAGALEFQEVRASVPVVANHLNKLVGMRINIDKGYIWRLENQIAMRVEQGFFHSLHEHSAREMGAGEILFLSSDSEISTDPLHPNIFEAHKNYEIKAGHMGLDVTTMQTVILPVARSLETYTEAIGYLCDGQLIGRFFGVAIMRMHGALPIVEPPIELEISGSVRLRIAF